MDTILSAVEFYSRWESDDQYRQEVEGKEVKIYGMLVDVEEDQKSARRLMSTLSIYADPDITNGYKVITVCFRNKDWEEFSSAFYVVYPKLMDGDFVAVKAVVGTAGKKEDNTLQPILQYASLLSIPERLTK